MSKTTHLWLGFSLLVMGCGGESSSENSAQTHTTDAAQKNLASAIIQHDNWVSAIQQDPTGFTVLAGSQRPALIALHKNDFKGALSQAGLSDNLRARAESELARLHHRLARVSRLTWATIAAEYSSRTGNTAPQKIQDFARLAQHSGWWGASQSVLELSDATKSIQESTDALSLQALLDQAQRPIDTIDGKIKIYSPLTHQGLVRAYQKNLPAQSSESLEHLLFSSCATVTLNPTQTKSHPYRCIAGGLLEAAGLDPENVDGIFGPTDDPQPAREFARVVDSAVAGWAEELSKADNPDGAALIIDLQLPAIYQTQSMLALSELLLDVDRPHQASAIAMLAQDLEAPKQINHLNSPITYALLAEAKLRTGHAREALDYLEVLVSSFPEITGLDETVGDLVVLQNLNRQGDSKEL